MSEFGISKLLNDSIPKKDTKKIYYKDIIPNENNYFDMVDIEKLADNILDVGLLYNLVVKDNGNNTYTLLAGHRRLAAIKHIINTTNVGDEYEDIPCKVLSANINHLIEQYLLITSNLTGRGGFSSLSFNDRAETVKQLEELFKQMKEDPTITIKGKMRDLISDVIEISPQQVQKYTTLNKSNDSGAISLSKSNVSEYDTENKALQKKLSYSEAKFKVKDKSISINFASREDLKAFIETIK